MVVPMIVEAETALGVMRADSPVVAGMTGMESRVTAVAGDLGRVVVEMQPSGNVTLLPRVVLFGQPQPLGDVSGGNVLKLPRLIAVCELSSCPADGLGSRPSCCRPLSSRTTWVGDPSANVGERGRMVRSIGQV